MKFKSFSIHSGAQTEITADLFEQEIVRSAQRVAANGGGEFVGPAGQCRAKISYCCGSALISLEHSFCKKPLGLAVVTWSELLATFVWGELLRAYEESAERSDLESVRRQVFQMVGPRMGTLIWPPIVQGVDPEYQASIEISFWVLGLAVAAERLGAKTE